MKELAEIQDQMKFKESEIEKSKSTVKKKYGAEHDSQVKQLRLEISSLSDKSKNHENLIRELENKKMDLESKVASLESVIKNNTESKEVQKLSPTITTTEEKRQENDKEVHIQNDEIEEPPLLPQSAPVTLHTQISTAEIEEIEYLSNMVSKYKREMEVKSKEIDELKKQVTILKDYSMKDDLSHQEELGNFIQLNEQLESKLQSHENQSEKQKEINGILENEKVVLQKENDLLEKEQRLLKENIQYYQSQLSKLKQRRKNSEPQSPRNGVYIELEEPGKNLPIVKIKNPRILSEREHLLTSDDEYHLQIEDSTPVGTRCCTIM